MVNYAITYSLIRSELTESERKTFADKMLNDINDSCTNQDGATWQPGDCGLIWFLKHHSYSPLSNPINYPPNGGKSTSASHNLAITKIYGYIAIGLALADDDPRAVKLLENAYDWFYDNAYFFCKDYWTGYTQSGSHYSISRTLHMMSEIAIMLKNSIASPPLDLTGGNWLKNGLPYVYYNFLPYNAGQYVPWGEVSVAGNNLANDLMKHLYEGIWLYNGTDEAAYANYWMRNVWSGFNHFHWSNGAGAPWGFVFTDPEHNSKDISELPTQYFFVNTDQSPTKNYNVVVSRTGWTNEDDTLVVLFAHDIHVGNTDHLGLGNPGSYKIIKEEFLLAEDSSTWANYADKANCIQIGTGDYCNLRRNKADRPQDLEIDKYKGDINSNYAYARVNLKGAYLSKADISHAYRHFLHLKKNGTQDYIIIYDDIVTNSKQPKKIFLHYCNKASTSLDGDTIISTRSKARLISKVLLPSSPIINAFDGTYTKRIEIELGDNTVAEALVVHKPDSDTNGILPSTNLISNIDPNFRGVVIKDSNPKIAIFPRNGSTYNSCYFTETFSGTAQIFVSGLTQGFYKIERDGIILSGYENVPVGEDSTLYFEVTGSSTFTITKTDILKGDLNNDGQVNIQDIQACVNHILGRQDWGSAADVNDDDTVNVLDVQEIVNIILAG